MRYFYDCEFLEGTQTKSFLGVTYKTPPTIDMISIGIVSEDNREYYAISKDFNLREAWNRFQYDALTPYEKYHQLKAHKVYWIRENILKPIWEELVAKEFKVDFLAELENPFTYEGLKYLINKYGMSNKQIAEEVYEFCSNDYHKGNNLSFSQRKEYDLYDKFKPQFYGYYSAYDHVCLCWLFGKMIDLPSGFPMYTIDLQQTLDELQESENTSYEHELKCNGYTTNPLKIIKDLPNYPKQTNEHNALGDAIWNKQLYEFLKQVDDTYKSNNTPRNGCI